MNILRAYHGSKNLFSEFSTEYIGQSCGWADGPGVYLSRNEETAKSYTAGGYLYTVGVEVSKVLPGDKQTINRTTLAKVIDALESNGVDVLSNIGDVSRLGYAKLRGMAIDMLTENSSDVDLLSELFNLSGKDCETLEIFTTVTGFTHIIGLEDRSTIVALSPRFVKIVDVVKVGA